MTFRWPDYAEWILIVFLLFWAALCFGPAIYHAIEVV
jgi:hypothetical protein